MISLTVLLTGLLLMGLLRREKYGVTNIGFESLLIVILYLASFAFLERVMNPDEKRIGMRLLRLA